MKQLTKKDITTELESVYKIWAGKLTVYEHEARKWRGLMESDCTTDAQKLFRAIIREEQLYNKKDIYNEVFRRLGLEVNANKEFTKVVSNDLIIRNLPANDKYTLIDCGSYAEGNFWCCENCGRIIRNYNEVVSNETGKHYIVGSECINTVLKFDASKEWETRQVIAEHNKRLSLVRKYRKYVAEGATFKTYNDILYFEDKRGRTIFRISKKTIEQYSKEGLKNK